MKHILAIQVGSFFTLGLLFLAQGNWKFGLAQILFGLGTLSIYA